MKKVSLISLVFIGLVLSFYRISTVSEKEVSWDVLGYYLPLPSTFIHQDPLLNDISWLKELNKEKSLAGTLYMVSSNEEGEPMYFFLLGMSYFYAPFFFIGSFFAYLLDYPVDGFSPPYQYSLVIGCLGYVLIGLVFFRKILKVFFSEGITSIVLIVTVFSTNYIHHLTLKNLETVAVLFMLICIVVWFTIQWHNNPKLKYLVVIGLGITFMSLVKPSEILIVIIPVLWGVNSWQSLTEKLKLIYKYRLHFIISLLICFLIASPQIIYWLIKTGTPFYDSYKNPGVGLDLTSPHVYNTLFSYRKGWLVYTPVMFFYLIGLVFLFKKNRPIFLAITVYFLTSFYIISSWTEWWYGAGFSNRPLIVTYPLLAISFGYFLTFLSIQKKTVKGLVVVVILSFTFLNQFQWWQLKNYILDPYYTTKEYYWRTFLSTSVSNQDKGYLLINRDFTGKMEFNNRASYHSRVITYKTFEDEVNGVKEDSLGSRYKVVSVDETYSFTEKHPFNKLTSKNHFWVNISFDLRYPKKWTGDFPCVAFTFDRANGNYGYFAPEIIEDPITNNWNHYSFDYLTPEVRSKEDELVYYIWNRGKESFDIDNFKVTIYNKNKE